MEMYRNTTEVHSADGSYRPFNPNSHKQIISVLSSAGWKPTSKTKAHIEALRERQIIPGRLEKYGKLAGRLTKKTKYFTSECTDASTFAGETHPT